MGEYYQMLKSHAIANFSYRQRWMNAEKFDLIFILKGYFLGKVIIFLKSYSGMEQSGKL